MKTKTIKKQKTRKKLKTLIRKAGKILFIPIVFIAFCTDDYTGWTETIIYLSCAIITTIIALKFIKNNPVNIDETWIIRYNKTVIEMAIYYIHFHW